MPDVSKLTEEQRKELLRLLQRESEQRQPGPAKQATVTASASDAAAMLTVRGRGAGGRVVRGVRTSK